MRHARRWLFALLSTCLTAGCDAAAKSRAPIVPQDAFADPRQVALATAAFVGDNAAIDAALKAGADINAVGGRSVTALWYSFFAQKKKSFAHLLSRGADVNAPNENGEPLLGWSVMADDADYLKLALDHGGNLNGRNAKNGLPILFRAISKPTMAELTLLLDKGADINIRARDGGTAATFASSSMQMDKLLFLLERGADPFLRNGVGNDIAAGIFAPIWGTGAGGSKLRLQVLKLLESNGVKFDWAVIEAARIGNLGEATGKEPPKWLKSSPKEPNPAWVKANPEKAEQWYQAVLKRPAPKY